jgi:hypothetical protein
MPSACKNFWEFPMRRDSARLFALIGPVRAARLLVGLAALAFFAGCGFNPPRGFGEATRGRHDRALSPDGVVYTERTLRNDPKADLEFWSKAARSRLEQGGYRVTGDSAVPVHGEPGRLLRLAAPLGERDYTYWIALSVKGRRIRLIEAAGETKAFRAREAEILAAITRK